MNLEEKIAKLKGPILILGSCGFIGANLYRLLLSVRQDVCRDFRNTDTWRLAGLPPLSLEGLPIGKSSFPWKMGPQKPQAIFDCAAYGGYSWQSDTSLIYEANFLRVEKILRKLSEEAQLAIYIHAGTSSEYGSNCSGPCEWETLAPNSDYAVSKVAASSLIGFYGKHKGLPCANLRLYSVYGPWEQPKRLIPDVIEAAMMRRYPLFNDPCHNRDFLYIEDACEAFIDCALNLPASRYGESFNIGTGRCTTVSKVAATAAEIFGIEGEPIYVSTRRQWEVEKPWFANAEKAKRMIDWQFKTGLKEGLQKTMEWAKSR